MIIPKKIHFCGHTYDVKLINDLDGGENLGRTHRDKLEIHLETNVPQSTTEETFIHELMHIAYGSTFSELKGDDEENRVKAWAKNIYGILKDNDLLK